MVNQRDPKQRITAIWMRDELLAVLDKARSSLGKDRSQFIRDAIVEKLKAMGLEIPGGLAYPPDRADSFIINESTSPPATAPPIQNARVKAADPHHAAKRKRPMKPGQ